MSLRTCILLALAYDGIYFHLFVPRVNSTLAIRIVLNVYLLIYQQYLLYGVITYALLAKVYFVYERRMSNVGPVTSVIQCWYNLSYSLMFILVQLKSTDWPEIQVLKCNSFLNICHWLLLAYKLALYNRCSAGIFTGILLFFHRTSTSSIFAARYFTVNQCHYFARVTELQIQCRSRFCQSNK